MGWSKHRAVLTVAVVGLVLEGMPDFFQDVVRKFSSDRGDRVPVSAVEMSRISQELSLLIIPSIGMESVGKLPDFFDLIGFGGGYDGFDRDQSGRKVVTKCTHPFCS